MAYRQLRIESDYHFINQIKGTETFFYYKKLLPNQQNKERNLRKPKIADTA